MEGGSCSKEIQSLRQEFPNAFGLNKPQSRIPDTVKFSCLCGVPKEKTIGETVLSIINSYPTTTELASPVELAQHLSYLIKVKPSYIRQRRQKDLSLPSCCCCDIILDCFVNNKLLTKREYEIIISQNCDCGCKNLLTKNKSIPRNVDYIVNMVLNDNDHFMNNLTDRTILNGLNKDGINNNKINCKPYQGINKRNQLCPIVENHETESSDFLTSYIEPSSQRKATFKKDHNYKYMSKDIVNQNLIDISPNNKNISPGINQNNIILCKMCKKSQEVKNSKHKLFNNNSNQKSIPSLFANINCRKCRKPKLGKNIKGKPKLDNESFSMLAKVNTPFRSTVSFDVQKDPLFPNEETKLCKMGYKHLYNYNLMNLKNMSSKHSDFLENQKSSSFPHIIQTVPETRSIIIKDLQQGSPINSATKLMNDKSNQPFPINNYTNNSQEINEPTMRDKLVDIIINSSVSNLERMSCSPNSEDRQEDTNVKYLEPMLDAILNDNNLQEIFKERLFNQLVNLVMKPPQRNQTVNQTEIIDGLFDQLKTRIQSPIIDETICQQLTGKVKSDHKTSIDPIKHESKEHQDLMKQIVYDISRHQSFNKRMISSNNDDNEDVQRTSEINSKLELTGICTTKNVSEVENINFNEIKSTASSIIEPARVFQTCVRKKVNVQVSTQFICENSSPSSLHLTFSEQCEMKQLPTTSKGKQIKATNTNENNELLLTKENRKIEKKTESTQDCNNSVNNNFSQTIEWNQCENILVSPQNSKPPAQTKSKRVSSAVVLSPSFIKIRQSDSKPFDPIPKGNTESLLMFHETEIFKRVGEQSNECDKESDNLEEEMDEKENDQYENSITNNENLSTCESISQMFSKYIGPNSKLRRSQSLCQLKLLVNNTLHQVVKQIFGHTLFVNSGKINGSTFEYDKLKFDENCDEDSVAISTKEELQKSNSTQATINEEKVTTLTAVTVHDNSGEMQSQELEHLKETEEKLLNRINNLPEDLTIQPLNMDDSDKIKHKLKHTNSKCSEACKLESDNQISNSHPNFTSDSNISELNKPKTNNGELCICKDLSEMYIASHNNQNKSVIFNCNNQKQEPNILQINNIKENLNNDTLFNNDNKETSDVHCLPPAIAKDVVYSNSKIEKDQRETLSRLLENIKKRNEIRVQLNNLYKKTFQCKEMTVLNIANQNEKFPEKHSPYISEKFKSLSEDSGLNSMSYQSLRNIISIDSKLRKIIKRLPESNRIEECNSDKGFVENKTFIVNSLETPTNYKKTYEIGLVNDQKCLKLNKQATLNETESEGSIKTKTQNIEQTNQTCSYINSILFKTSSEEIETCILCSSGNWPTRPYTHSDQEKVNENLVSKLNVLLDEISVEINKDNIEYGDFNKIEPDTIETSTSVDTLESETYLKYDKHLNSLGSTKSLNKSTNSELGKILRRKWLGKHCKKNTKSNSSCNEIKKNISANENNLWKNENDLKNVSQVAVSSLLQSKRNMIYSGKSSKIISQRKAKSRSNPIQQEQKKGKFPMKFLKNRVFKNDKVGKDNQTVKDNVKISPPLDSKVKNNTIDSLRTDIVEKYKNNNIKQTNASNLLQPTKKKESVFVPDIQSSSNDISKTFMCEDSSIQKGVIDYSVQNPNNRNHSSISLQSSKINPTLLKRELKSDGHYCIFEGTCSEENKKIWQPVTQNGSAAQKFESKDNLSESFNESLSTNTTEIKDSIVTLSEECPRESEKTYNEDWFENYILQYNRKVKNNMDNHSIEPTEKVPLNNKTLCEEDSDSNNPSSKLLAKLNSPSWQKHTLKYYLEHGDKDQKINKGPPKPRRKYAKLQMHKKLPSEKSLTNVPNKSNILSSVKHLKQPSTGYHDKPNKNTPCGSKEEVTNGNNTKNKKAQNDSSLPKDVIQYYVEQLDQDSNSKANIQKTKTKEIGLQTVNEVLELSEKAVNKFNDYSLDNSVTQFNFDCPKYTNHDCISLVKLYNNSTNSEVMNELLTNENNSKAKGKCSDSVTPQNDITKSLQEQSNKQNKTIEKNSQIKEEMFKFPSVREIPKKDVKKNKTFSSQNDSVKYYIEDPNDISRIHRTFQKSNDKENMSEYIRRITSNESLGKCEILSNKQNTTAQNVSSIKQASSSNIQSKYNALSLKMAAVEESDSTKILQKSIRKGKPIEIDTVKYYVNDSIKQNKNTAIVQKKNKVFDSEKKQPLTDGPDKIKNKILSLQDYKDEHCIESSNHRTKNNTSTNRLTKKKSHEGNSKENGNKQDNLNHQVNELPMVEPNCEFKIKSTSSHKGISESKLRSHELNRTKLTDSKKEEAIFLLVKQLADEKNKRNVPIKNEVPNVCKPQKTKSDKLSTQNTPSKSAVSIKTTVQDENCKKKSNIKLGTHKKKPTSKVQFSPSCTTLKVVKKESNKYKNKQNSSQSKEVLTDSAKDLLFDQINLQIQETFEEEAKDKSPPVLNTYNNNNYYIKPNHEKTDNGVQSLRDEIFEILNKKFGTSNWQNILTKNERFAISMTKSEEDDFSYIIQTMLDKNTNENISTKLDKNIDENKNKVTKPQSLTSKLLKDSKCHRQKSAVEKPTHPSHSRNNVKAKVRNPIITTGSTKELVTPGASTQKEDTQLFPVPSNKEIGTDVLTLLRESVNELTHASDVYEFLRLTLEEIFKTGSIDHDSI